VNGLGLKLPEMCHAVPGTLDDIAVTTYIVGIVHISVVVY